MRGTEATITVNGGLEIRTELDPARQAFLDDHRIDGTPVLPGVMGMEAFAETAAALAPGYAVTALEDVELQAPFKFYRDEPRTLEVRALVRDGRRRRRSSPTAADRPADARRRRRADDASTSPAACGSRASRSRRRTSTRRRRSRSGAVVEPRRGLPRLLPRPGLPGARAGLPQQRRGARPAWRTTCRRTTSRPPGTTRIVPRLIELCFQTAGVWELGTDGVMGLPTHVDRVLRYAGADAPGPPDRRRPAAPGRAAMDADVVDEHGVVRIRLEGYRTTALPVAFDDDALAPLRAVVDGAPS